MARDPRVEFEKLAERIVRDAERVSCSKEQFVEGLEFIEAHVRERAEAARGDG